MPKIDNHGSFSTPVTTSQDHNESPAVQPAGIHKRSLREHINNALDGMKGRNEDAKKRNGITKDTFAVSVAGLSITSGNSKKAASDKNALPPAQLDPARPQQNPEIFVGPNSKQNAGSGVEPHFHSSANHHGTFLSALALGPQAVLNKVRRMVGHEARPSAPPPSTQQVAELMDSFQKPEVFSWAIARDFKLSSEEETAKVTGQLDDFCKRHFQSDSLPDRPSTQPFFAPTVFAHSLLQVSDYDAARAMDALDKADSLPPLAKALEDKSNDPVQRQLFQAMALAHKAGLQVEPHAGLLLDAFHHLQVNQPDDYADRGPGAVADVLVSKSKDMARKIKSFEALERRHPMYAGLSPSQALQVISEKQAKGVPLMSHEAVFAMLAHAQPLTQAEIVFTVAALRLRNEVHRLGKDEMKAVRNELTDDEVLVLTQRRAESRNITPSHRLSAGEDVLCRFSDDRLIQRLKVDQAKLAPHGIEKARAELGKEDLVMAKNARLLKDEVLSPEEKLAMFDWRNGLRSEAERIRAKAGMCKLMEWVVSAENLAQHPFEIGHENPVVSLTRHGIGPAGRKDRPDERKIILTELDGILEKLIDAYRDAARNAPADLDSRFACGVLEYWRRASSESQKPMFGMELGMEARLAIMQAANVGRKDQKGAMDALESVLGRDEPLSFELLKRLGRQMQLVGREKLKKQDSHQYPLAASIDKLRNLVEDRSEKPSNFSADALIDLFQKFAAEGSASNSVVSDRSNLWGVNLSATQIIQIFTGGVGSASPTLALTGTPSGHVLAMNHLPNTTQVMAGKVSALNAGVGIEGGIGPKIAGTVLKVQALAANAGVSGRHDNTASVVVASRHDVVQDANGKVAYKDDTWRAGMSDFWEFARRMVREMARDRSAEGKGLVSKEEVWSEFVDRFYRVPTMSVCLSDNNKTAFAAELAVSTGMSVAPFSSADNLTFGVKGTAGLAAGATVDKTSQYGPAGRDVKQSTTTASKFGQIGFSAGNSFKMPEDSKTLKRSGAPTGFGVSYRPQHDTTKTVSILHSTDNNGLTTRLDASWMEKTFTDPKKLRKSIMENEAYWLQAYAVKYDNPREALDSILNQLSSQLTPSSVVLERWYIRPEAAQKIDALTKIKILAMEADSESAVKEIEQALQDIMKSPDSWMPGGLWSRDVKTESKSRGVATLGVAADTSRVATQRRELTFVLSLDELRKLDLRLGDIEAGRTLQASASRT